MGLFLLVFCTHHTKAKSMNSENVSSHEVKAAAAELMSAVAPAKNTGPKPRVGSFLLSWLAIIAGLAVLAGSAYMFYLFAENDWGVKVLLSAFALCFGAGSLAFGPLFIIGRLIGQGRKNPLKRQAFWVLALSVPWMIAGGVLITYPNAMRYAGLLAVSLSALFALWSIRHLSHIRTVLA